MELSWGPALTRILEKLPAAVKSIRVRVGSETPRLQCLSSLFPADHCLQHPVGLEVSDEVRVLCTVSLLAASLDSALAVGGSVLGVRTGCWQTPLPTLTLSPGQTTPCLPAPCSRGRQGGPAGLYLVTGLVDSRAGARTGPQGVWAPVTVRQNRHFCLQPWKAVTQLVLLGLERGT